MAYSVPLPSLLLPRVSKPVNSEHTAILNSVLKHFFPLGHTLPYSGRVIKKMCLCQTHFFFSSLKLLLVTAFKNIAKRLHGSCPFSPSPNCKHTQIRIKQHICLGWHQKCIPKCNDCRQIWNVFFQISVTAGRRGDSMGGFGWAKGLEEF